MLNYELRFLIFVKLYKRMGKNTMIEFTENMMIGVPHIDAQHREMVGFLNKSLELCNANPTREEIEAGLNFLASYVTTHFRDEEELQIECNYPNYQRHKEKHEAFVESFLALKSTYANENVSPERLAYMLVQEVMIWVVEHVEGEDIEFGRYYNQVKGTA